MQATVSRTVLELEDLDLPGSAPATGLYLVSITRAGRAWRRTYATSPYLHGAVQTHATLETASLAVSIGARASTGTSLKALRAEADAAFSQFLFDLTVDEEDGSDPDTFECDCADIAWGEIRYGMTNALVSVGTLTIPCYPLPVGGA